MHTTLTLLVLISVNADHQLFTTLVISGQKRHFCTAIRIVNKSSPQGVYYNIVIE